ncbi:B12-binding domain-containing radical SAM protein [Methylobacterium sp. WSM2598]|uniref:B12-binding domain-containing radical SAM protein n=1 Tax=Methylobacterium sp. WSM2598 TaxID=398261 RepID=UPI00036877D2|nr:B12-binding domain-containing radical SAM protein [Methylobacterium sp. WSM2598]
MPAIYIVNPANSAPSYHTAEFFGDEARGWVQVADLTVVTLAALVPADWHIRITDESIDAVDLDAQVDVVAITGKVSQRDRMIALADAFRRRGRTVMIGGSFATLTPEEMRPHADILVTGEVEEIAAQIFSDIAAGRASDRYDGGKADIRRSPVPRWDLYPVERASSGALQTTRGCPFSCEFCDVIQYQGRKQRHKDIAQIVAELDALYAAGFRQIFLVDDNFTVHRAWARKVLDALTAWNAGHEADPVLFLTQASLDVARDPDLLERCHEAGIRILFVGIETVNEASLRETGKKQNLLQPVESAIAAILQKGIAVQAGIIVGFDHDSAGIFDQMRGFFDAAPIPELNIGVLTAPHATDLYRRLAREGRLLGASWETAAASPFSTNIVPAGMSRRVLLDGVADLCAAAYMPEAFGARMLRMIAQLRSTAYAPARRHDAGSERTAMFFRIMKRVSALGPREAEMVREVVRAAGAKPSTLRLVVHFLSKYGQVRYFLDGAGVFRADASARALVAPERQVADAAALQRQFA